MNKIFKPSFFQNRWERIIFIGSIAGLLLLLVNTGVRYFCFNDQDAHYEVLIKENKELKKRIADKDSVIQSLQKIQEQK